MNTRCRLRTLPAVFPALVLVLLLCLPARAGQAADAECAVSPELAGRVRDGAGDQAADVLARLDAVCAEGFPLAPFESKVAEGLAKGVPPAAIVRALGRKLDAFRHAAAMLRDCGAQAGPGAVAVLGEGVFGGVPDRTLRDYVCAYADREPGPFLWGLEMACLLNRAGFDDVLTMSVLDAGFEAGALTRDWRYFVRVVLVARQRGVADQAVADAARVVLLGHGAPSDVSARLGFTDRDLSGRGLAR